MEIFIRNIPVQSSDKDLREFLTPYVHTFGISVFHCNKFRWKPLATVTVLDVSAGSRFLDKFGRNLKFMGQTLQMSTSNRKADELLLRSLQMEATSRQAIGSPSAKSTSTSSYSKRKFAYNGIYCGYWDYDGQDIKFYPQCSIGQGANLVFGKKTLIARSRASADTSTAYQLYFLYSTIQSMTIDDSADPCIMLSLSEAPRMYEQGALHNDFGGLHLTQRQDNNIRVRIAGLNQQHEQIVASCLVYRIKLDDKSSLSPLSRLCNGSQGTPASIPHATLSIEGIDFRVQKKHLEACLDQSYGHFDFPVRFQVQRLVQNGFLTPRQTLAIINVIDGIFKASGSTVCANAIHRMSAHIPFSGPENQSSAFDYSGLSKLVLESKVKEEHRRSHGLNRIADQAHVRPIHRVLVTPTGQYLEGPDPETINRVIRSYPSHTDHFLHVAFCEENFEQLRFERTVSLQRIIRERFQKILDGNLSVAGRNYEFLGFSHSSLRRQSCWFMASIQDGNVTTNAAAVIAGLGDFSMIRIPARCAARIGQAFSDTTSSVPIPKDAVTIIDDIKFNNRCFSDGVGTMSRSILQKIWDGHPSSAPLQPKLYQIRYAGAKGMISLDTRLKGDVLKLRKSMVKFEGSQDSNIEVCGSSARSLPMYLNRQYIKIMNDLGVPRMVFLDLQKKVVESLSLTTANPINAANFLEKAGVCMVSRTPGLIRNLFDEGFDFREDSFLRGIVELVTLAQLRDIKYRARITVNDASTLYGIMDETDTLDEGQVFCQVEGRIIEGKVLVTRSPALHPGDLQMATAVTVSEDSPLRSLNNCVVFSQRGKRDLPSQLSGGDLDGDLYSVAWNPLLHLPRTVEAADYPPNDPVDIQRPVQRGDMTKFFLDFFENDQLGRIATLHTQLADRFGVEHPDCKTLAALHSTAVDFSKTGIKVSYDLDI